jgi:hypothetical protein
MVERPALSGPKRSGRVTNVHKARFFPIAWRGAALDGIPPPSRFLF